MPSPVGHTLVGLGVALGALMPRGGVETLVAFLRERWLLLFFVIVLANLPDIDYVPGLLAGDFNAYHHLHTHTMGWVFLLSLGLWLCWRAYDVAVGWRQFILVLAVMGSHLLADFFTADGRAPYGIMALWPFADTYYISPRTIFWKLMKKDWADVFQWYNVVVVSVEALWGLVFIGSILLWKRVACRVR